MPRVSLLLPSSSLNFRTKEVGGIERELFCELPFLPKLGRMNALERFHFKLSSTGGRFYPSNSTQTVLEVQVGSPWHLYFVSLAYCVLSSLRPGHPSWSHQRLTSPAAASPRVESSRVAWRCRAPAVSRKEGTCIMVLTPRDPLWSTAP